MNTSIAYILARLREPSTWSGLCAVLMVAGINLTPDLQEQFSAFFVALSSVVGALYAIINIVWKRDTQSKGTGDGNS